MIMPNIQMGDVRNKTIKLSGGLNNQIASMERGPGELSACKNYMEREGSYSGYVSIAGYERYDGQTKASEIARETYDDWANATGYVANDRVLHGGYVFYCTTPHTSAEGVNEPDSVTPGNNTWWDYEGAEDDVDEYTDRKREAQRALITEVEDGDSPSGPVRGLHVYGNTVYAVRNNTGATAMGMYKTTASGWDLITAINGMTTASGSCKFVNARFADYNSNNEAMFWVDAAVDGVHVWNGSAYSQITAGLPTSNPPVNIGVWENRLFVVYSNGHIFFSKVGDPTDYDSSTGYAGEIYIGEAITDVLPAAGVLLFFTRKSIKVLHYGSTTGEFIFKLDDFSKNMGSIGNTAKNLFEVVYFCDDRGPSRMLTSAETGGFAAENIGEKVEQEYNSHKSTITGTLIDIVNRRYYVFWTNTDSTSDGFIFTINKGKLKGIGRFELEHKATVTANGITDSGTPMMLFGDDSGYVFLMESGTSFDGSTIDTSFTTSYYHYGTPRHWKHFLRLHMEIDCGSQMPITVGSLYDYGTPLLANPGTESQNVSGGSSTWGSGIVWGSFTWGAGVLGRGIVYTQGYGSNMAIVVTTSSKYFSQHTVHNLTADYIQGGVQQ